MGTLRIWWGAARVVFDWLCQREFMSVVFFRDGRALVYGPPVGKQRGILEIMRMRKGFEEI